MKSRQKQIYAQLAAVGQSLSNEHRLKTLNLLCHGERSIDELASLTGQSLAAASAHIKQLRATRLVVAEKRGRSVYCRLANDDVAELWLKLRDLGEHIVPEIREIMREDYGAPEELSPLTVAELHEALEHDHVNLLDLRPAVEYKQGHLPTADNIPFDILRSTDIDALRNGPVLVYCRGPFCAAALEGNQYLRENALHAQRLRFSVPEWKAHGFPLDVD